MILPILANALTRHRRCAEVIAGREFTCLSLVPSLRQTGARSEQHPLASLLQGVPTHLPIVSLVSQDTSSRRTISSEHFSLDTRGHDLSHVLLIDDTWTSGAHMSSATLSLRKYGARMVSAFAVARWLRSDFQPSEHIHKYVVTTQDRWSPGICPWTSDGHCPQR